MNMHITDKKRRHLATLREVVHERSGIKLPDAKETMIASRLARRISDLGMADIDAYLSYLFDKAGLEREIGGIIDLLTTNKTDFFREPAHFDLLTDRIIPEAIARTPRRAKIQFKAWSAAASTGAEAWTIAMLLDRAAQADPRLDWRILGTDISERVLATGRRAIYPAAELAPVPADFAKDYVMVSRPNSGPQRGRIVPELRGRVRFQRMNLKNTPYQVERDLDVVFLRNVLIYFEPELQQKVISACASHLRPNGYLIVGHSESMMVRQAGLSQVAPGAFLRIDAP